MAGMAPLAVALATKVVLAVLSLVAAAIALVKALIKPSDSVVVRVGTVVFMLVLVAVTLGVVIFGSSDGGDSDQPSQGVYQSRIGEVCDGLDSAARKYGQAEAMADPYNVIGPWKIYEGREADLRELRPPSKLADLHAQANELAKRHAAAIASATNDLLAAKSAADRRTALQSDKPALNALEHDLAADLRKLGRDDCRLSAFGT
jgi:hypothetical protein